MEGERSLTIVTRARVEKWKGDKEERTGFLSCERIGHWIIVPLMFYQP